MDVQFNESEFDKRQNALAGQIVRAVHNILDADSAIPDTAVNSLTASITFSICSLLDGNRQGLKANDIGPLVPMLAFALNTHRQDAVMLDGTKSWMHEYVHGWVTELYGSTPVARYEKPTAPCPYCGEPLRTPKASFCRFCKMDWRDPDNVHKRDG